MTDIPVEFIVAAFQDPYGAERALEQLKQARKEGLIAIEDAAVLTKDADGKLRIKETGDMGGGKGAAYGGVVGGVIGILGGPLGVAAGAGVGAAIGGLAAKMRDGGFPDARLRQVGEGLKPGTSAIVAVIDHIWVAEVERQLQQAGADTVTQALSADIARQLEAGKDVAYSAVSTSEAAGITRIAAGADETEMSTSIVTDQGMLVQDVVQTKDDVTAVAAVITDQGAVVVTGTGKLAAEAPAPEAAAAAPAPEASAPAATEAAAPAPDEAKS